MGPEIRPLTLPSSKVQAPVCDWYAWTKVSKIRCEYTRLTIPYVTVVPIKADFVCETLARSNEKSAACPAMKAQVELTSH